jgi:hypothetical protein
MTTIQIVGIAVAAAIIAVLIAALIITRDKGKAEDEAAMTAAPPPPGESFLDQQPSDSFDRLGKPEIAPTLDPVETTTTGQMEALDERASADDVAPAVTETPAANETPVAEAPAVAEGTPVAEAPVAEETPAQIGESKLVALSDIIVTTSNKMVDLADPEVRRMLRDLVKYEIDQAAQFKEQGQSIDAALQLTEAVKICEALDMTSQARLIRAMMKELRV